MGPYLPTYKCLGPILFQHFLSFISGEPSAGITDDDGRSVHGAGRRNEKVAAAAACNGEICLPGTQMILVFIGKGLVLEVDLQ